VQPQVQQQVQPQVQQQMGGFMLPSPIMPGGVMLAVDTSQNAMAQDGLVMETGGRRRRAPSFGEFEPRMPSMPSAPMAGGIISVTKLE
jgi:hypothetical protein